MVLTSAVYLLSREADGPLSRTDCAMAAFAVLSLVDTALMLLHWDMEGNALLLAIGPGPAAAVKIAATAAVVYVWFRLVGPAGSLIGSAWVWALLLLYSVVTGVNVAALAGVAP